MIWVMGLEKGVAINKRPGEDEYMDQSASAAEENDQKKNPV